MTEKTDINKLHDRIIEEMKTSEEGKSSDPEIFSVAQRTVLIKQNILICDLLLDIRELLQKNKDT